MSEPVLIVLRVIPTLVPTSLHQLLLPWRAHFLGCWRNTGFATINNEIMKQLVNTRKLSVVILLAGVIKLTHISPCDTTPKCGASGIVAKLTLTPASFNCCINLSEYPRGYAISPRQWTNLTGTHIRESSSLEYSFRLFKKSIVPLSYCSYLAGTIFFKINGNVIPSSLTTPVSLERRATADAKPTRALSC